MRTLGDLVLSLQDRRGTAISWREKERKTISFPELYIQTVNYAKGFLEQGLGPGDNVAIFTRNSAHWLPLVLGMSISGISDVPRELFSEEEAKKIINHSDAKMVIVENEDMLKFVGKNFDPDKTFSIEHIEGVRHISEIYKKGRVSFKDLPRITPEMRTSIIYTSGTTGEPKGAMLSHGNYMSNIEAVLDRIPLSKNDKFLAILPQWHVYGRIALLAATYLGAETFYVTNIKSVLKELQEEKPTMMASVPRVWELVYKNLVEEIRKKGSLIKGGIDAAIDLDIQNLLKNNHSIKSKLNHTLLEKAVYSKLREKLGGNLTHIVSGGSALSHHLKAFFYNAGLKIAEGYGMTETSPIIAGGVQDVSNLFTVGPPLKEVSVKIINPETREEFMEGKEGIIYVKGSNVMQGYYNNPEATVAVLSDGWLNTGDLGYFKGPSLSITGRIGENIKLSNGEMINPRSLEASLEESQLIDIAVVIGKSGNISWKNPGALILPNYNELKAYANKNNIAYKEEKSLIYEEPIRNLIQEEVNKTNSAVEKPYEKIAAFKLIPELETGKGLTATKKIKRPEIANIYSEEVLQLDKKINK